MTSMTDNNAVSTHSWQLKALTEALGDLTLSVSDSLSVGRGSDNDVVLGSKEVSRNHALLTILNDELYIKDLDSSNGTFVNDKRIAAGESKRLAAEDMIRFASFNFQVNAPVAATLDDEQAAAMTPQEPALSTDTHAEPPIIAAEPVVKETGIEEVLSASNHDERTPIEVAPVIEEQASIVAQARQEPAVIDSHDKTTKTALQEEADPDVLRAKQAATAQFSGTANLGQSRDLGTEGNNALDQAIHNPANAGQVEKKPSGGWFIWVFIAILIIGLALWLFNKGGI